MAVTRLKRKEKKNVARAKARVKEIKRLNKKPVIKNVDIEAIKAEFASKSTKVEKKAAKKEEPVAETPASEEAAAQ